MLALEETTIRRSPAAVGRLAGSAREPVVHLDAVLVGSVLQQDDVLAVAHAVHGVGVGRVVGIALGQVDVRGRPGSRGRRPARGLPST